MLDDLRGAGLVVDGDEVVASLAGGPDGSGAECTAATRFQVASVSKQFVAATVLALVDQGGLSLGDPVNRWVPGGPMSWAAITVRHLLNHTAGLGHWLDIDGFAVEAPWGPTELIEAVQERPLLAEPGTEWRYSGVGYVLAARVAEEVAGQPYEDILTSRILEPCGLAATGSGVGTGRRPDCARGHHDGRLARLIEGLGALAGTGDLWSTVGDLARWVDAVERQEDLPPPVRAALRVPVVNLDVTAAAGASTDGVVAERYGHGSFFGSVAGHPARFHPGDNPGFVSFLARLADRPLTVVLLANDDGAPAASGLRRLLTLVEDL